MTNAHNSITDTHDPFGTALITRLANESYRESIGLA